MDVFAAQLAVAERDLTVGQRKKRMVFAQADVVARVPLRAALTHDDIAGARLLAADANTRVRFVPASNFSGTVNPGITYRAWDQTSGANGGVADASTNGGETAFSLAAETASITVTPVNDAPLLDNSGSPTLTALPENPVTNPGDLVSAILASAGPNIITDPDTGAVEGIAVSGVRSATSGEGSVYSGTFANGLDVAATGAKVTIFPVNRVGRPLGATETSTPMDVPAGSSWAFETGAVGDVGVGNSAYPAASISFAPSGG